MASALLDEQAPAPVVPNTSADGAGERPASPLPSGGTSERRGAGTAAGHGNAGVVQRASPSLVKPQGEAVSTPVSARERGRRIGSGVHLARLLSASLTGLVVLAGAALVLPVGPADLSARLPQAISEVAAAVLQRAAGFMNGGDQAAIRTDAPGAPVEAQSDEAQIAVAPAEPADTLSPSLLPETAGDAAADAGSMTGRDAASASTPEEAQSDAQIAARVDTSIQAADEVAGVTLSEPAVSAGRADGDAAGDERQTGNEAGVAVAAPVPAPEDPASAAPVASARDAENIGEGAATADRQPGDGADRGAAEREAEPSATAADAPARTTEEASAGPSSASAADTEGAVEDATTTEPQPRDAAGRGAAEPNAEPFTATADAPVRASEEAPVGTSSAPAADSDAAVEDAATAEPEARDVASLGVAEPKAEPTETSPAAPSADGMVRVTAERLNMRDGPGTDAAVVGGFDRGTRLRVVGRDGEWVKAEVPDGRSGWLSARFVETVSDPDAGTAVEGAATAAGLQAGEAATGTGAERASGLPAAAPAGEVVRVTAERLNMRGEPSTDAAVVGAFDRGAQLTVLDRDGQWIKAQAPDGRSGWFSARFLEGSSDGAAAASEDPTAREAARLRAVQQAADSVSPAAEALADIASQLP